MNKILHFFRCEKTYTISNEIASKGGSFCLWRSSSWQRESLLFVYLVYPVYYCHPWKHMRFSASEMAKVQRTIVSAATVWHWAVFKCAGRSASNSRQPVLPRVCVHDSWILPSRRENLCGKCFLTEGWFSVCRSLTRGGWMLTLCWQERCFSPLSGLWRTGSSFDFPQAFGFLE